MMYEKRLEEIMKNVSIDAFEKTETGVETNQKEVHSQRQTHTQESPTK